MIPHTDGQRTTGTPLADHGPDHRGAQLRHDKEIARDGLTLAALLGTDTRIGTGSIDEGEDRQLEVSVMP